MVFGRVNYNLCLNHDNGLDKFFEFLLRKEDNSKLGLPNWLERLQKSKSNTRIHGVSLVAGEG